ncbi:MAG: phage tail tape measure protein, partial [Burkholderiales bacterium]|nr:phage tail tape measure protein [Burkholderiales bacterium]
MKLSFIIEAIDKATAPVRKVNQVIDRMTEPARRVRASFNALVRESGLPRLGAQASEVSRRFGDVTSAARGVVGAVAVITGTAVGAFYGLKRIADEGDRAVKMAERLGLSVDFIQKFGYAAKLSGSSSEEAGDAMRHFSRNAVEAATGNKEMAVWFQRAGISADFLKKNIKDPEALLRALSDNFATLPDGPKKTAISMNLLGRSGANLINTLNMGTKGLDEMGAELESLGGLIDKDAAKSMESFNDNWDRLLTAIKGVGFAIAKFLIPFLDPLIVQLKDWIAANRALATSRVTEFLQAVIERLPAIWQGVTRFTAALVAVIGVLDTVARTLGGWEVVLAAIAAVIVGKLVVALFM